MQWAPDSPDLWAPDSGRPRTWATDSFEHLTLGWAIDLFLGAKAAEGASPKTITWYRMILERAVRAFGAEHSSGRTRRRSFTATETAVQLAASIASVPQLHRFERRDGSPPRPAEAR